MRKKYLISLAIATIAAYSYTHDFWAAKLISECSAAEAGYAPQVSNERDIKITATLQTIPNAAKTWDFEVTLESHTQTLSDDLTKSAVLIAGGKQYPPLGWEGAPPGGHHRKGRLHFNAIAPQPSSIELQIRLSVDSSPRNFKWLLK